MRSFLLAMAVSAAASAAGTTRPSAEQLVRHILPRDQYSAMMQQMSQQAINALRQQGSNPSPDQGQRFQAAIQEALPYDELVRISSRIYSEHFTDREIGDILAFYKTATGAKFTHELPAISGDSMREATRIIQSRMPELLAKHGLVPKQGQGTEAAAQPQAPAARQQAPR
ncbi:MAG TPA: DUF2059 domain-containing protein [Myxococcales bacterium]|nr:DUF2059 domain-containing protein [Myxococcales bacterium]